MNQEILAPGGRFYLVAVEPNKPLEIVKYLSSLGLQTEVRCCSFIDRRIYPCLSSWHTFPSRYAAVRYEVAPLISRSSCAEEPEESI
jgi:hypothetical protein